MYAISSASERLHSEAARYSATINQQVINCGLLEGRFAMAPLREPTEAALTMLEQSTLQHVSDTRFHLTSRPETHHELLIPTCMLVKKSAGHSIGQSQKKHTAEWC